MKNFFQNTKLTLKNFRSAIMISFVTMLVIFGIAFSLYRYQLREVQSNYDSEMQTAVNITDVFVEQRIESISSKLKLISNTYELKEYMEDIRNEENREKIKNKLYNETKYIPSVTQIRILDTCGQELVRINQKNDSIEIVPKDELQNKADRYYFQETMKAEENQIYISDFDLNIENGEIVVPYEPTIRFGVKICDEENNTLGILIINVDGYEFFKTISEYEELNEKYKEIGILDCNNYWSLSNLDENNYDEIILTMDGEKETEISEKIREGKDSFTIGTQNYIVKKIQLSNEYDYYVHDEAYPWYIVGEYDMKLLAKEQQFLIGNFIPILLVLCVAGVIVSYSIMILIQIKANNHLLLIASSYISDNSQDGIVILNKDKRIVYCNYVFEEIYALNSKKILNKKMSDIFNGQSDLFKNTYKDDIMWSGNVWNKSAYGNLICKHLTIQVITDLKKRPVYYIGIYTSPYFLAEKQSIKEYDDNVFLLSKDEMEIISTNILASQTFENIYAILSIQVSGGMQKLFEANQKIHGTFISKINDALELDKKIHIMAVPRSDIMVFAIFKSSDLHVDSEKVKETDIRKIVKNLEFSIKKIQLSLEIEQLEIKFNVGVAVYDQKENDILQTLKNSLIALEVLTKFKKTNMLIYNESFYDYIKEDLKIRGNLRIGFDNHEFKVVYQPQFRMENNTLYGIEALIRWNSEKLGNIQPDRFIPIMEETEEIYKLGVFVVKTALEELSTIKENISKLRLSMNLSSKEFSSDGILYFILQQKSKFDEIGIQLCIEITETTLIENIENAKIRIKMLQENGIEVAIDDFGTGYSSLGYLKELYANELKIDKMFISDFPEKDDGKLITAVISMGKKMNMSLVVEGIESKEQYDLIKETGADLYQGYYGSLPLTIQELKSFMQGIASVL